MWISIEFGETMPGRVAGILCSLVVSAVASVFVGAWALIVLVFGLVMNAVGLVCKEIAALALAIIIVVTLLGWYLKYQQAHQPQKMPSGTVISMPDTGR